MEIYVESVPENTGIFNHRLWPNQSVLATAKAHKSSHISKKQVLPSQASYDVVIKMNLLAIVENCQKNTFDFSATKNSLNLFFIFERAEPCCTYLNHAIFLIACFKHAMNHAAWFKRV